MDRLFPLALLMMVAVAVVAPAASTASKPCDPYSKYEELGKFAVNRYNEQNHGNLCFESVKYCSMVDRGTGHSTYRFITIVTGGMKYDTEVLEDLSAPGYPPVHNFGYFKPV